MTALKYSFADAEKASGIPFQRHSIFLKVSIGETSKCGEVERFNLSAKKSEFFNVWNFCDISSSGWNARCFLGVGEGVFKCSHSLFCERVEGASIERIGEEIR